MFKAPKLLKTALKWLMESIKTDLSSKSLKILNFSIKSYLKSKFFPTKSVVMKCVQCFQIGYD